MDLVIVLNHGFPCLQVKYYNLMSEIYCRHTHKYVQLRKEITILEKKKSYYCLSQYIDEHDTVL